jgi:uncharacterized membrane protein
VTVVSYAVEIDAPAERVWAVVSDPRSLPSWDRHIVAVEGAPAHGLHTGASYTTTLRLLAVRAKVRARVVSWEPPHRAVIRLTGLLDAVVTTIVEPLDGDRSRLRHEVDYRIRGGPLGDLAARSLSLLGGARFLLRRGTLAQKREVEDG